MYFLYYGSGSAWLPFFNVYLQQIGLSSLQIGLLASMRPAVMLVSQPLWGAGADLWGRRRLLLVTMLLSAILLPGYASGSAFLFFLGWTILYTFFANPVGPLLDSFVLDHLEERPHISYGQLRLWGAVGWGVLALVAGALATGRDLRLTFLLSTVLMLTNWLLALRSTRDAGRRVPLQPGWQGLGTVLRNRKLLAFLALVTLLQTGAASIFTFYPVYMNEIGASRQVIGFAYSLQGMSELPLYLAAAAIIRRIGSLGTLIAAFAVFAVRLFLYSFVALPALAAAVELLHGLSFSLFLVASVDYVNQQVPRAWRATGQSLFWTAYFGAGAILGNTWAGFWADRVGVQQMFRINSGLVVIVVVAAWVLLPGGRPRPSPPGPHSQAGAE